jgi:hypothetical protein
MAVDWFFGGQMRTLWDGIFSGKPNGSISSSGGKSGGNTTPLIPKIGRLPPPISQPQPGGIGPLPPPRTA